MLIYGGNHFFNVIDDYLYLYHLYKNNPELICVPFNKKGEYLNVEYVVDYMTEMDIKKLLVVPECSDWYVDHLNDIKKYFRIYGNGEGYEYIYDNKLMSEMQGSKWKKFRWKIKSFVERYGEPEFVSYDVSLRKEIEKIYDNWCSIRPDIRIWDGNFYKEIIKLYPSNTHLIKFNKEFIGFVTCVPFVNNSYFEVNRKILFNKYENISQYIQWKQSCFLWQKGIRYLNDSDDSNMQGLRNFKMQMHPVRMFKNVTLGRNI